MHDARYVFLLYGCVVHIKRWHLYLWDKSLRIQQTEVEGKIILPQNFFNPQQISFQGFHTPTKYLLKVHTPTLESQAGYFRLQLYLGVYAR